ncbi:hypothetical protein [Nubsella zeaxanthinifaciens]|uniref:hypothetical protein n=1 Tax=Nubsella zeaxanthinifaciens TaxID=392412 RepID=UPI000DE34C10|nr:hypothetical protein [Nubsella zeaxanthinifaciens]
MIAITNTTAFDVQTSFDALNKVPSASVINSSIQGAMFKTTQITTALKNLLVSISNSYYNVPGNIIFVPFDINYPIRVLSLFSLVGFGKNAVDGTFIFSAKPNNLDKITSAIIDELIIFKSYIEKAKNAFKVGTWAQQANIIRGMQNADLQKLHELGVYNSTNENTLKLLNIKPASTGRFLEIETSPSMPVTTLFNYSNTTIRLRIRIEHIQKSKGLIKRIIKNYFPEQINSQLITHNIAPNSSWQINYENKIRGGECTIEYLPNNETWNSDTIRRFIFYIRGTNPASQQVKGYLDKPQITGQPNTSYLSRFWFLRRLIRHESASGKDNRLHQFYPYKKDGYGILIKNGLPVFGAPRGYGLGQIDNYGSLTREQAMNVGVDLNLLKPGGVKEYQTLVDIHGRTIDKDGKIVSSDEAIWNWKINIDSIIDVLESKVPPVLNKINSIKTRVLNWNNTHPDDKVIKPNPVVYGDITYDWVKSSIAEFSTSEINALFLPSEVSTGTKKSFFDAMLLKTYNGLGVKSLGQFHFLDIQQEANSKPVLSIHEDAGYYDDNKKPQKNYYVRAVTNTDEN